MPLVVFKTQIVSAGRCSRLSPEDVSPGRCRALSLHLAAVAVTETSNNLKSFSLMTV